MCAWCWLAWFPLSGDSPNTAVRPCTGCPLQSERRDRYRHLIHCFLRRGRSRDIHRSGQPGYCIYLYAGARPVLIASSAGIIRLERAGLQHDLHCTATALASWSCSHTAHSGGTLHRYIGIGGRLAFGARTRLKLQRPEDGVVINGVAANTS